jgi:hypothetical protein
MIKTRWRFGDPAAAQLADRSRMEQRKMEQVPA